MDKKDCGGLPRQCAGSDMRALYRYRAQLWLFATLAAENAIAWIAALESGLTPV